MVLDCSVKLMVFTDSEGGVLKIFSVHVMMESCWKEFLR